jgi:hypothetical protein
MASRNDLDWTEDEHLLALDLYFRFNPLTINKKHASVVELSDLLNRLPIHPQALRGEKFRNPDGVYMKLCNFLRLDPSYAGKGLSRGAKGEEVVWNRYAGRVSNEIVHEVDTFVTFAKIAGPQVPQDRPIDGVDQIDFLLGRTEKSNREGFPVFVADRLETVKWRNWKIAFYDEQRDWWTPPLKLGEPKAFDLITDPKEEYPATALGNSWNAGPALKIVTEFEQSLKKYPPIAPGTPDPYTPPQ